MSAAGAVSNMPAAVRPPGRLTVGLDISALDAGFKEHAARGIGRYVRALHEHIAALTGGGGALRVQTFDHRMLAPTPLLNALLKGFPAGRQTLRQQVLYPLRLRSLRARAIDIVHFPAHMDPPAWSPLRYVVSVMDLIPFVLADLYRADRPGWRFRFARYLETQAIRNAALVLTISEQTARDVTERLGVPEERIVVTPLGVERKFFEARRREDEAALRARYGLPAGRPLVLYVGGIDQRKNCRGLLEVFGRVLRARRAGGLSAPLLLMAGKIQQDRQYPALIELARNMELLADISMPGYVPDDDLLQLYPLSSVFLFMSLYEGFGLPPLEALAAGTPVVSSNSSAMPEVLGKAALLVHPEDYEGGAAAVLRILADAQFAAELKERGRAQARAFTWTRTAELTLAAYERFLD